MRNKEKKQIALVEVDAHGRWTSPIIFDEYKRVDPLDQGYEFVRWHTS